MTSHGHLRSAARCWERAWFFEDAAERFTSAEAWYEAGRCFSQADRHTAAALAYSRAGEPLLEAREYLLGARPERARSLYERLRSGHFDFPSVQVEILLGLGKLQEATRVALISGDREAVAMLARLTSTLCRPDLTVPLWSRVDELSWKSFTPWNRSLLREVPLPVAEPANAWPSVEYSHVSLVPIWEEETGGSWWGDRALDWSTDGLFFAAVLGFSGLIRGRISPTGVRLQRWDFDSGNTICARFLPASYAVLTGLSTGKVFLVDEPDSVHPVENLQMPGEVWSITFAPQGNRVAVSANSDPGAQLKVSSWPADAKAQRDEHRAPEARCSPLTSWSPDGHWLFWSPGPYKLPNRLFQLGQEHDREVSETHGHEITSLAFAPNGRFLISASVDRTVVLRHGQNGQSFAQEQFEDRVFGSPVHPKAALIAVCEGKHLHLLRLRLDEAPGLSRLSEHTLDERVTSLAFSPDGRHLLAMTFSHLHLFRVDLKP